jgi:serine/threonine-protein kinase
MPLVAGQTFAGYTIVRLLGAGGMGAVYLAQHPRLPRQDAIKVLPSELTNDPEYTGRFLREAELAATLSHPHIVGIHDRGESDDHFWISMDYVAGTDAAQLLHEQYPGGMPADEVLPIITAVASALDYAHYRGLLHRDVKPANILLTEPEGQAKRVFLADFGIARQIEDSSKLTATNMAVGTAAYAAPEQLLGQLVDGRADQYALACTAFHLLTGAPPYEGSTPAVVITQHVMAPVPSLREHRPELGQLDPALGKALAKKPDERFPTCQEFARALQLSLATPPGQVHTTHPAPPPSTLVRTPPPSQPPSHASLTPPPQWGPTAPVAKKRSRRVAVLVSALVVLALLVAGGVFATVKLLGRHDGASTAGANPGPFTGRFRADYGPGTTLDGETAEAAPPITGNWDVRSVCRSSGCVATASYAGVGGTSIVSSLVFDQIGGSWVAVALGAVPCDDPQAEAWVTYTLQPRPDGSFFGVTARATTNGCASARRTVTFTRIGDADTANLADPSTLPPRVMSLASALYGRYHQSMTYTSGALGPEGSDLAAQTYCLRTGERCISLFHAPKSGVVTLIFSNGKWTQNSKGMAPCRLSGSAMVTVTAEYPLPQPPDDPIPLLTGHGQAVSDESTCQGGEFDIKFERIGD